MDQTLINNMLKLLNLGCGQRFSKDPQWINTDIGPHRKGVISHDVRKGIPLADKTVDAVYHSHLLEHFSKREGTVLASECFRVLKPGGIIRVVVPDLENICKGYLEALERSLSGDISWQDRYDWMMLEMYDQAVRTEPGGEMAEYLSRPDIQDKEFIIKRIGSVARDAIIRTRDAFEPKSGFEKAISILKRFKQGILKSGFKGERHKWMYDKYSLRRLLAQAGFTDIRQCAAKESSIPGWDKYFLDIDADGLIHAPSSIYMEGIRPK